MADYVYSADLELRTRNLKQVTRDIHSSIRGVKGTIDVGVGRGTQSNIQAVNRKLETTSKNLRTVNKAAKQSTDSIESFGKASALAIRRFAAFTVVTTGFITLSRSIRQSLSDAIDFQREVLKISQVTGKTIAGLRGLTGEITRLSTTLGVSSSELLQVSRIFSQTGLAAKDVQRALQAIARSDLSPTFDNMIDTGEASIAIMRQFGLEAGQLESKLSAINSVSKQFAVESSDITTAVRRTGGAFQAAGGNLEEFIALFTSVRSTTRESAESIATGFRTIFTRLQRTRTQNFLKDLGIDLKDSEGQFVGPLRAIQKLSSSLSTLRGTDPRFAQIIEELGGFRQITKVIPLIKEFATTQKALVVAQTEQNSLASDAALAQEALAVKIAKVREEFEALIRTVADSDSFKVITNTILATTKAIIQLSDALVPLLPAITSLAAFGALSFGGKFFNSPGGFLATLANPVKKNSGGIIPGVGNTDTVPAMLTPGEFVLSKKAVAAAGKGNLIDFNNAARFNTGGLVGGTSTSTKAIGGAVAAQVVSNYLQLDGESKKVIDAMTTLAVQFGFMNSALKGSIALRNKETQILKLNKRISNRGNLANNLGSTLNDESEVLGGITGRKREVTGELSRLSPKGFPLGAKDIQKRRDLQKELVDLSKQEGTSRERISKINRLLVKADDSRLASNQKLLKAQKAQRAASIAGGVGIALAAVAGVVGSQLSESGANNIEAGGQSTGLSGAGGALTGAATGAALGAIAGPWGIAIGGAVGALVGFVDAVEDARNRIKEIALAKSVKEANDLFKAINSEGTNNSRAFEVNNRLRGIREQQVLAAGDAETSKNVQSEINSSLPELRVFLNGLAKSSSTFNEFEKRGSEAVRFLALQTSLPIDKLNEEFKEIIKTQQESKRVNQELIIQQQREAQRIRELNSVLQALAKSAKELNEFQSNFALQGNLASGGVAGANFTNTTALASQLNLVSDINEFSSSVADFGKLFGEAGERLASEITTSAEVAKTLPDILEKLKRDTDSGFSKDGELVSNLDRELKDVPAFIREAIIKQAREIIGSEGKDATLINAVRKDSNAVAKQLLTSLDSIGKIFSDAGEALANRKNVFTKGLAEIQAAIDNANRFRFAAIDIRQQRLGVAAGEGGLSQQQKNLEFDRKLNVIAEGGPRTVGAIQNRLEGPDGARARLQRARENFQNLRANGGQGANVQQAADEFGNANREVVRLTNSLKFLADSTIKVKSAQDELAKIEAQKNANQGLLTSLAFGSSDDKLKLSQQVSAFNKLSQLSQSGQLGNVDKNILSQLGQTASPFFQQFKNQEFQGVKVSDLQKEVVKQIVGPQFAAQFQPSQEETGLKAELQSALKEREDANLALAKNTQTSINDMVSRLGGLFTTFISNLQSVFLENEKSSAENAAKDAISQIGAINNQVAKSTLIEQKTGLNTKEQIQLQKNQSEFNQLNKLDSALAGLSSINQGAALTGSLRDKFFSGFKDEKEFVSGQGTGAGGVQIGSGEKDVTKVESAREALVKTLVDKKFDEAQISEFNKRFTEGASKSLQGSGITPDEAARLAGSIITDITNRGIKDVTSKRTSVSQSIVDNSSIPSSKIKEFQDAQRTQGGAIKTLRPDLLENSNSEVSRLVNERDRAKNRASVIDGKINNIPAANRVPAVTPNTSNGQFQIDFKDFDKGTVRLDNIYKDGAERFENAADKFGQVAKNIPSTLELGGAIQVEVVVNGADVLNQISPSIEKLITDRMNQAIGNINNAFKSGVPVDISNPQQFGNLA